MTRTLSERAVAFWLLACCALLLGGMTIAIRLLGPRTNNQQLDAI